MLHNKNKVLEDDQYSEFEKLTNQLTDLVYFLVFLVAIPGVIGSLSAGIALIFVDEVFFIGEINLAVFIITSATFIPFGLNLFKLIRKKQIWYKIELQNKFFPIIGAVSYLFLPFLLIGTLFFILGTVIDFKYYITVIPYIIIPFFPWLGLIFTYYYKYGDKTKQNPSMVSKQQASQKKMFFKTLQNDFFKKFVGVVLIKIVIEIGFFAQFHSLISLLILNSSLYLTIVALVGINTLFIRTEPRRGLKTEHTILFILQGILVIYLTILGQIILYSPISTLLPNLSLEGYVLTMSLILGKIILVFTIRYINKYSVKQRSPPQQFLIKIKYSLQLVNQLVTTGIFLLLLAFGFFLDQIPASLGFTAIGITGINLWEKNKGYVLRYLSDFFIAANLLLVMFSFSFIFLQNSFLFELIVFTSLSILIPIFLFQEKAISSKLHSGIYEVQILLLFIELGTYFAFVSVFHELLILNNFWFNYLFFLALSGLACGYRLYFMHYKVVTTWTFAFGMITLLGISMIGLFLIFFQQLLPISWWILFDGGDLFSNIKLFRPTGFLNNFDLLGGFWSFIEQWNQNIRWVPTLYDGNEILWNFSFTGFLTVLLSYLIIKLHEMFDLLGNKFLLAIRLGFRTLFWISGSMLLGLTLISVSSFLFIGISALWVSPFILEAALKATQTEATPFRQKIELWRIRVKKISVLLIIPLVTIFSIELLGWNIFLGIELGLLLELGLVNSLPMIKKQLTENTPRNYLKLNNAIIIYLIWSLIVPAYNFYSPSGGIFSQNIFIAIILTFDTMFIGGLTGTRQLYKGNIIQEFSYRLVNFILSLCLLFSLVVILFPFLNIIDRYSNLISYMYIIVILFIESIICQVKSDECGKKKRMREYMWWKFTKIFLRWASMIVLGIFLLNLVPLPSDKGLRISFYSSILFIWLYRTVLSLKEIEEIKKTKSNKMVEISREVLSLIHLVNIAVGGGIALFSIFPIFFTVFIPMSTNYWIPMGIIGSLAIIAIEFRNSQISRKYIPKVWKFRCIGSLRELIGINMILQTILLVNNLGSKNIFIEYPVITISVISFGMTFLTALNLYTLQNELAIPPKLAEVFFFAFMQNMLFMILISISGLIFHQEKIPILLSQNYEFNIITWLSISVFITFMGISFYAARNIPKSNTHTWRNVWKFEHICLTLVGSFALFLFLVILAAYNIIVVSISLFAFTLVFNIELSIIQEMRQKWSKKLTKLKDFVIMSRVLWILLFEIGIVFQNSAIPHTLLIIAQLLTILIEIGLNQRLQKYLNSMVQKVLVAASIFGIISLVPVLIIEVLNKNGIPPFAGELILTLTIIISFFSLAVFTASKYLAKHTIISNQTYDFIVTSTNFTFFTSITLIIGNLIENGFTALNLTNPLVGASFISLLSLFSFLLISRVQDFIGSSLIYSKIYRWLESILWNLSLIFGSIFYFTNISITPATVGLFITIGTIISDYSLTQLQGITSIKKPIIDFFKFRLKEINLVATSLTITSIYQFIQSTIIISPLLLISLMLMVILIIWNVGKKFYSTPILNRIRSEIMACFIFVITVLVTIFGVSKYFYPDLPLYIFSGLLILPVCGLIGVNYIISNKYYNSRIKLIINQILELLLLISINLTSSWILNENYEFYYAHFLSAQLMFLIIKIEKKTLKNLDHSSVQLTITLLSHLYLGITAGLCLINQIFTQFIHQIYGMTVVSILLIYYALHYVNRKIPTVISKEREELEVIEPTSSSEDLENQKEAPSANIISSPADSLPRKRAKKEYIFKIPYSINYQLLQLGNFVSNNWATIELLGTMGIILATMISSVILIVNNPVTPILGILLLCGMFIKLFTDYQNTRFSFLKHVVYSLLIFSSIQLFYHSETDFIWATPKPILILFSFLGIAVLVIFGTNTLPANRFLQHVSLGLYYFVSIYYFSSNFPTFSTPLLLLLTTWVIRLSTFKYYRNFIFNSIPLWISAYVIAYYGIDFLQIKPRTLQIILTTGIFGLTAQYAYVKYKLDYARSYFSTFIGTLTILGWIGGFIYQYIHYTLFIERISPVISGLLIISLIVLQKVYETRQITILLNAYRTIFSGIFVYTFFKSYITPNLEFSLWISLTLAISVVNLSIIFVIQNVELKNQRIFILSQFTLTSVFFGISSYLFLIEPNLNPLSTPLAIPIALDLAILAFYLCLGIYYRSFEQMWKFGEFVWIMVPIINFTLVSYFMQGINTFTNALQALSLNLTIEGSVIITIIICSLMYLPVILTTLKQHISKIIYIFWLEFIFLTIWGTINLFPNSLVLQIPFASLIGLIFAVPLYYLSKQWKALTIVWIMIASANIIFLHLFFSFALKWQIPIDILVGGLYCLSIGYFPNIQKQKYLKLGIITASNLAILGAIFSLTYSFMVLIIVEPLISVNLTIIFISTILLSGKYFGYKEAVLKIIHASLIIVNIGILVAKSFSLLGGSFLVVGIFIGIGFACGTTLTFQLRNYLPRLGYRGIWYGMATSFGLASYFLLQNILQLSIWASIGGLIIVLILISLPIMTQYLSLSLLGLILGISFFIFEGFLKMNIIFIQKYKIIILLDIIFSLELIYLYSTKSWVKRLFRKPNQHLEYTLGLGIIHNTTYILTVLLLMNNSFHITWYINGLIFIALISINLLLAVKFVEKRKLFIQIVNLDKFLINSESILKHILYFSNGLIFALIMPVFNFSPLGLPLFNEILLRICYFNLFLLIEMKGIEQNLFKHLPEENINWISLSDMVILTLALGSFLYLQTQLWFISLFIMAILNFYSIDLINKIKIKVNRRIANLLNTLLINLSISVSMWEVLPLKTSILEYQFDWMIILLIVNILIILGGVYLKLYEFNHFTLEVGLRTSIALYIAEVGRIYLNNTLIHSISIFILLAGLLNLKIINTPKLAIIFWISMIFSGTVLIFDLIRSNVINLAIYDLTIIFIIVLTFITTIINQFLLNQNRKERNDEYNLEEQKHSKILENLIIFPPNFVEILEKIHIFVILTNYLVFGIITSRLVNNVYYNQVIDSSDTLKIIWIFGNTLLLICAILVTGLIHIIQFIKKREINIKQPWISKWLLRNVNPIKFTSGSLSVLSLFYLLWPLLNIGDYIVELNFSFLLLGITLSLGLLFLLILVELIPSYQKEKIKTSLKYLIALLTEELCRNYVNSSIWLNSAVFLLIFGILNWNWRKQQKLVLIHQFLIISGFMNILCFIIGEINLENLNLYENVLLYACSLTAVATLSLYFTIRDINIIKIFNTSLNPKLSTVIPDKQLINVKNREDGKLIINDDGKIAPITQKRVNFEVINQIPQIHALAIAFISSLAIFQIFMLQVITYIGQNLLQKIPRSGNLQYLNITISILILGSLISAIFLLLWTKTVLKIEIFANNSELANIIKKLRNGCLYAYNIALPLFISWIGHLFISEADVSVLQIIFLDVLFLNISSLILLMIDERYHHYIFSETQLNKILIAEITICILSLSMLTLLALEFQHVYLIGLFIGLVVHLYGLFNLIPAEIKKWVNVSGKLLMEISILIGLVWLNYQYDIIHLIPIINYFFLLLSLNFPFIESFLLFTILLHLVLVLDKERKEFKPIHSLISNLMPISWFFFIIAFEIALVKKFLEYELFFGIFICLGIAIGFLFYENSLIFKHKHIDIYKKMKRILLFAEYITISGLILAFLIPLHFGQFISENYAIIFSIFIYTGILSIFLILGLNIDKRLIKAIPAAIRKKMELIGYISVIASFAVNITFYLIINVDFPTLPTSEPGSGIKFEQIMFPILIISLIISPIIIIKYRNKRINQIIYILILLEIIILLTGLENYILLIIIVSIALLAYPLLFFLEQLLIYLRRLLKYIHQKWQDFVQLLRLTWKFIVKMYFTYQTPIFILLGFGIGMINYFLLYQNLFFSGLLALLTYFPVSPERHETKNEKDFGKKILYRGLIAVSAVGSAYRLIPSEPWIYSLFILAFFGYVLWTVRKSEEIFNLPIYWRFTVSVIAIIDFIFMIIFILNDFEIISIF